MTDVEYTQIEKRKHQIPEWIDNYAEEFPNAEHLLKRLLCHNYCTDYKRLNKF
jgi:hypothetical protein